MRPPNSNRSPPTATSASATKGGHTRLPSPNCKTASCRNKFTPTGGRKNRLTSKTYHPQEETHSTKAKTRERPRGTHRPAAARDVVSSVRINFEIRRTTLPPHTPSMPPPPPNCIGSHLRSPSVAAPSLRKAGTLRRERRLADPLRRDLSPPLHSHSIGTNRH